jgi:preprotein translocase subunit SecG
MTLFLTVLHVMVCLFIVVVVLLQRGKGAEIGAVFGGGSGSTIFGSRGAGNFLTKLTTGAAVVFMLTSLSLAYFAQEGARSTLFDDDAAAQEQPASPFAEPKPEAPAAEAPAAAAEGGFQEVPPAGGAAAPVEPPAQPSTP